MKTPLRLLAVSSILLLSACSSTPSSPTSSTSSAPAGMLLYSNPSGVTIKYRADWTMAEPGPGMATWTDAAKKGNVILTAQPLPPKVTTLEEYTKFFQDSVFVEMKSQGLTYKQVSSAAAQMGGKPAKTEAFTLEGQTLMRGETTWTVANGKVYTFTVSGEGEDFDDIAPAAREMLASVTIE